MKASDIRVASAAVTFSDERLAVPLRLSRGVISEITHVEVVLHLVTRRGTPARGVGSILLSDVWAFPHPVLDHQAKDAAMRSLCEIFARRLPAADDFSDPLEKHHALEHLLDAVVAEVEQTHGWTAGTFPRLAALNCMSPFDAAIHDGWGRAANAPVYALYSAEWLNADLGVYFGKTFQGTFPNAYLRPRRTHLVVQHVVGVGDVLAEDPSLPAAGSGLPATLTDWIRRDGLTAFKVKTKGQDPEVDGQRLHAVYTAARAAGVTHVRLSADPNEACPDAAFVVAMLAHLARHAPDAYAALEYIEQPTGRDLTRYPETLHQVAVQKPVIIDESFDTLDLLPRLHEQGWSGVALKTCKGQSSSLLAYCWAQRHGLFATVQDLTNPGRALVHSANFCAHLDLAVDTFECNSRQYMPQARPAEQAEFPSYFRVKNGTLRMNQPTGIGLYI